MKKPFRVFLFAFFFIATLALLAPTAHAGEGNHHAAIFLGNTDSGSKSAFTYGADYEYRLPFIERRFGIGVILDFAQFDPNISLYMGAIFYHFLDHLKLILAAGTETVAAHGTTASHSDSVFRYGLAYDFHIGRYSISPTVSVDNVNGHTATVYGLGFGISF